MAFEVGGYRATHLIGRGGGADIWGGIQLGNGAPVTLKVFPPDGLAAAQREAAFAAAVDHPHVLPVVDVVGDEARAALVTESAAGGDLEQLLLRRGTLSAGETLTVVLPVVAALATAHERGVVHGDLSAPHVLFDRDGRPLLGNLGASMAALELGLPVAATAPDAAPELARGARPAPECDMFSVGSLAMACLTGRHAWPADDLRDVLIQAAAGQWPDPGDNAGPPGLVAAIRALLEHDPDRRPGAASLLNDLQRAGRPDPIDLALDVGPAQPLPASDRIRHALVLGSPPHESGLLGDFGSRGLGGARAEAEVGAGAGAGAGAQAEAGAEAGAQAEVDVEADVEFGYGPSTGRQGLRIGPEGERRPRARATSRLRSDLAARPQQARRHRRRARPLRPGRWVGLFVGTNRPSPGPPARPAPRSSAGPVARPTGPLPSVDNAGSRGHLVRLGLIGLMCLLVAGLAGGAGLWWAGVGRTEPVSVSGTGPPSSREQPSVAGASPAADSTVAGRSSTRAPVRVGATVRSSSPGTAVEVDGGSASAMSSTPAPTHTTSRPDAVGPALSNSTSEPDQWTQTVEQLDSARARALVLRDAGLLDAVYTPDSPARSADRRIIEELLTDGLRVSGALHVLRSVRAREGTPVRVEVDDSLPAYSVLDAAGHVVGTTAARSPAPRVLVLVRTARGYRISRIDRT